MHYDEYGREVYDFEDDDRFYEPDLSFMSLCCRCANLDDEPGYYANCSKYPTMTPVMFGRKKKCKHYYDINKVPIPDDYYYYYYGGEE